MKVVKREQQETGQILKIEGRFRFSTHAGDFRYGDFEFEFEDSVEGPGTRLSCKRIFNLYDVFLMIAREDPESIRDLVERINSSPQAFQNAHRQYMEEKYPTPVGRRRRETAEKTDAKHIDMKELDL